MQQQRNPAQPSQGPRPEPVRAYAAMNTVRALECLAFTALSAPRLADSLQVSVRTARRLLKRLAIEGFVIQERDHRRRYHPTLRLAALGRQLLDHTPLTRAAAPHLTRLAHHTSCPAHLWIPGYEGQLVCALHADKHADHPTVSVLHHTAPAATNAAGTVLLKDRAHLRSSCYLHQTVVPPRSLPRYSNTAASSARSASRATKR
jgi:DNA-binding IclR family transcriptional regulator